MAQTRHGPLHRRPVAHPPPVCGGSAGNPPPLQIEGGSQRRSRAPGAGPSTGAWPPSGSTGGAPHGGHPWWAQNEGPAAAGIGASWRARSGIGEGARRERGRQQKSSQPMGREDLHDNREGQSITSRRTSAKPLAVTPRAWAAPWAKSMIRPPVKGPRSLIRTTVVRPL